MKHMSKRANTPADPPVNEMRYAEVAVDAPVFHTFDYHIPPELDGQIETGHLVQVGFATAIQHGIVLRVHDQPPPVVTKPILTRVDARPVVTAAQIAVAQWMAETYLAPIGVCLWLWLPPGITGQRDLRVSLSSASHLDAVKKPLEREIVTLLSQRGALTGRQLDQALPGKAWRAAVDDLAHKGVIVRESIITAPRVRPKTIRTAALAVPAEIIPQAVRLLERPSHAADLLERLVETPDGLLPLNEALLAAGATRAHADRLEADGLVSIIDGEIRLLASPDQTAKMLAKLRKIEKPLRILRVLARETGPLDVSWVYAQADANVNDLKRLQDAGLIHLAEMPTWRDPLADRSYIPTAPPALTGAQTAVWERIRTALTTRDHAVFLLHGVTGSGKTEIYLHAIEETLAQGRTAMFLVPEIALTPQTVRRVAARFQDRVAVLHSGISDGERYDTWWRARDGQVKVIVGARSALFAPLPNLGLIVLDEEHDSSYKQSQVLPAYHTRTVAQEIMRRSGGVLLLGSATPDVETYYHVRERLELPNRIMGHRAHILAQAAQQGIQPHYRPEQRSADAYTIDLPPVRIVDMRQELKAGNTSIFSRALQVELERVLEQREQAILFLNRRGQATYVFCRDCGYVERCPRCDTPLTYHRQGEMLRCHRCDYSGREPTTCRQCGSKRIKYFGAGTQQVEKALLERFPKARVVRWDADTARSHGAHEAILQRFTARNADIMVGTQMVAKGLDLPMVTLVGVVSADIGLALPDFRAAERTFQVLTQVAGRAGRGLLGGQVILQTYQPEHYAIQAAAAHDYRAFYEREIAYRRDLGYPPFRRLVRIIFRFPTFPKAQAEAERAAQMLKTRLSQLKLTGTELIGPAPCFFTKENNQFRWHLILRGPDPTEALRGWELPRGWHVDVDPVEVL